MYNYKNIWWIWLLGWLGGQQVATAQRVCGSKSPSNYQVGEIIGAKDTTSIDPGTNGIPGEGINQRGKRPVAEVTPDNTLTVRSRDYVLFLAIHVLGKKGKKNVENDRRYQKMIKQVNDYYKQCNVGFIVRHFEYLDYPKRVFRESEWQSERVFRKHNKPRLINVYYVDTLYASKRKPVEGLASFPVDLKQHIDRIIIAKSSALSARIMAHELGHYFGLLHTHDTDNGKELVNGLNSHTAGDLITDTPADPNLYKLTDVRTCKYKGNLKDDNGDLYHPDPSNLMSYAFNCRKKFSLGQCDRIRSRLMNSRAYLERQTKNEGGKPNNQKQGYTPLQWNHPFRKKLSDLVMTAIRRNQNKILILAGHSMVNWSRRLKQELTQTPAIANYIRQHYAFAYLEVNENVDRFFKLTHDNEWIGRQRFYKSLRQALHQETARVPSLIIIQFDQRLGKVTKSAHTLYRIIGYRKPNEIKQILGVTRRQRFR